MIANKQKYQQRLVKIIGEEEPLFSIEQWNNQFPFDSWWRSKYNFPFGSEMHRNCYPIYQAIEFEEHLLKIDKKPTKKDKEEDEDGSEFLPDDFDMNSLMPNADGTITYNSK